MGRVIFGFILFGTALAGIMFGGFVLPLLLGSACVMGGNEFIGMARAKGINPSPRIIRGMIIAFFVVASLPVVPGIENITFLKFQSPLEHFSLLLTIGIFTSFFRLLFRRKAPPATIADIASTILGFIYVGFLPAHLVLLRNLYPIGMKAIENPLQQPGLAYVWVSLFIIWATDVFAYYVGKKWGKHLLYPLISPKKTVEGAIGGFLASIFWATVVVYCADHFLFNECRAIYGHGPFLGKLWQAPLMGAVVSIAAQLGDLCESMLKRDAGMKDSSTIIPGHGGFLDRGDSLIMSSAVCYYWVSLIVLGIL